MSALPQILSRNWTLKLSAFGLAVFLWAVVRAEPADREDLSSVPVRVQIGDLGWSLASDPEPSEVQVRFAGPAREILRLNRAGAYVLVPIETVSSPDTVVALSRNWVVLDGASGLVVQDIVPGSIVLTFEESSQESVPLAARTTGQLPRDLALTQEVGVTPGVIRVRGPARRVRALDSVRVESFDLSSVESTGMYEVAVDTTGLSGLTVSPLTVQLGIRVEPAAERLMPSVPVEVEGPAAAGLEVSPTVLPVTLRGARGRLDATPLDSVRLIVPAEQVQDIVAGEERSVPVIIRGISTLLRAEIGADSVTVRRPRLSELPGGGPDTAAPADRIGGGGS